ncbi:MAG: sulfatase-like hydrolase/transferase [Marinifilaceae bacterium]
MFKKGFLLLVLFTIVLALSFTQYLFQTCSLSDFSMSTILYNVVSCLGQAFLFALLPFVVVYMPLAFLIRKREVAFYSLAGIYTLLLVFAELNRIVFRLYRFHINSMVIDLATGDNAGQIFVAGGGTVLNGVLILAIIVLVMGMLIFAAKSRYRIVNGIIIKSVFITGFLSVAVGHIAHIYAAAFDKHEIMQAASSVPYFYPATANGALLKMGIITHNDLYKEHKGASHSFLYPKKEIVLDSIASKKNIFIIALDSWNPRVYTNECQPCITGFAKKGATFTNHFSASNGTSGSIFGLFYGIASTYKKQFDITGTKPLLIHHALERDYRIETFPSATLKNPPFHSTVFGQLKDITLESEGETAWDRDCFLTQRFEDYLAQHVTSDDKRPLFSFLFYDLMHEISLPSGVSNPFQPTWTSMDYTKLKNQSDIPEFFNLYANCAYAVDSLVGRILNSIESHGLLSNSIVIIIGDHGQEFNENGKGFWGHNGNFSKWQLQVPLVVFDGEHNGVYDYRTTHLDIVPTLMKGELGVLNEIDDYCMGKLLWDPTGRKYHVAGNEDNYALIFDNVIYEKKTSGRSFVTDTLLNTFERKNVNGSDLINALEFKNSFIE